METEDALGCFVSDAVGQQCVARSARHKHDKNCRLGLCMPTPCARQGGWGCNGVSHFKWQQEAPKSARTRGAQAARVFSQRPRR